MWRYLAIIAVAAFNLAVLFFCLAFMVSGVDSNDDVMHWFKTGVWLIAGCTVAALIVITFNRQGYADNERTAFQGYQYATWDGL